MGRNEVQSHTRHGETFWKEEKDNFGLKVMQKLGWSHGDGLGRNRQGSTQYIKAQKKADNSGLGLKDKTRSEMFVAATGVYNDLLKRLNANVGSQAVDPVKKQEEDNTGSNTTVALEKYLTGRRLYSKFRKSKQVDAYSAKHLGEILGKKAHDNESTPSKTSGKTSSSDEEEQSLVTRTSKTNISDYFKSKASENGTSEKPTKPSRFHVASGQGFSEQQQASYYDMMMGLSQTGRSGLGFSGGGMASMGSAAAFDEYADKLRPQNALQHPGKSEPKSDDAGSAAAVSESNESEDEARRQRKLEKARRKEQRRLARLAESTEEDISGDNSNAADDNAGVEQKKTKKRKAEKTLEDDIDTGTIGEKVNGPENGNDAQSIKSKKRKSKHNEADNGHSEQEPNGTDAEAEARAARKAEKKRKKLEKLAQQNGTVVDDTASEVTEESKPKKSKKKREADDQ